MTFAVAFKAKFRKMGQFGEAATSSGAPTRLFLGVICDRPVLFCLKDRGKRNSNGLTKLACRRDFEGPR